jgi:hypothetical protein
LTEKHVRISKVYTHLKLHKEFMMHLLLWQIRNVDISLQRLFERLQMLSP